MTRFQQPISFDSGPRGASYNTVFSGRRARSSSIVAMVICLFALAELAPLPSNIEADVVILEATPSGLLAGIAAAGDGHRVVVITPYKHIGGMRTSGLSMPNLTVRETLGGLGREFHNRVFKYYSAKYGAQSPQAKECDNGFFFEPHVAEKIFLDWVLEAGVVVLSEERIVSVQKRGEHIVSVHTNKNRKVAGKVFIDASYEGDLLAMAGAAYDVGRDSRDRYKESMAGMTFPSEKEGMSSDKIQRYVYRVVLTDSIENQVPIQKPANYHRAMFMIEVATLESNPPDSLSDVLSLNRVPNQKTDVRVGEGWIGGSHQWPEATPQKRETIAREHQEYAQGYLWFLCNDPSVPQNVRNELRRWGYAKDEFVDNEHWPYQLYVREARRLNGDFVMTEHDILNNRFKPDPIAIGSYMLDIHPVQYVLTSNEHQGLYSKNTLVREGGVAFPVEPYEIPFRSLLPKKSEVENLLVSVCVSSSHIAFSTIRMEPVYMMLGHAAGLAASISLQQQKSIHDIAYKDLRTRLLKQGAVLSVRGL